MYRVMQNGHGHTDGHARAQSGGSILVSCHALIYFAHALVKQLLLRPFAIAAVQRVG